MFLVIFSLIKTSSVFSLNIELPQINRVGTIPIQYDSLENISSEMKISLKKSWDYANAKANRFQIIEDDLIKHKILNNG